MSTALKHKSWNSFQGFYRFSTIILAAIILAPGSCASAQVVRINSVSSFAISSSPASLTARAGGASVSSTVNVSALNSFKGTVSLAVSGVPAEVTAAFNESTVSAGSSVRLTATAGATATPGTYPLTITGTSGATKNAATVELIIPSASFSLAASEKSVRLLAGQDGWNLPIKISVMDPSGLDKPVSLSVSGLPANVKSAFTSVNATTQDLTFNVGSAAVPGTYPIKVTGTSGSIISSTTVALVIPSPSFTISPTISAFTLLPGGNSGISVINVVDQNGFAGSVNFSLSGVPAGVNGSLSAASSDYKTGLILAPGHTPAPGTYKVVVTGQSGSLTSTATIVVTVPAPSFSLASSPSAVTATAGGSSVSSTINIANPSSASSGVVSVAVSGAPAGVTTSLNESTVTSSSPVQLSVKASSDAVPGTYPLTITGASGSTKNSTIVQLTIPKTSFGLSASVGAITLLPGGTSASSNISIADQGGYNGNVAFSVSGVPAGVSASFNWASSAYYTVLTLKPGANATAGTYNLLVTGTSGRLTSTATIAVTISAPSFGIGASPNSLTALQGGSNVYSAISVVNPVALSNPNVNLVISGVPAGVSAKLNWPVASAASPVSLTVTADSSTIPGTYPITISGTTGSTNSSTTVQLIIPKPSFSLSASMSAITLTVGENGWDLPVDISILNQAGLSNPVTLAVSGLPANVTSAFTPVNATTQGLTFKVGGAATPGTYAVTVTGTSGTATSTTTVMLSIPSPGFTLSPTVSAITLPANGLSSNIRINVVDQSGFSGGVVFSVAGLPSGVTAQFDWPSSAYYDGITLLPSTSATPGTYNVVVTGICGQLVSSTTLVLTIPVNFTVAASPSTLTLVEGGPGQTSSISVTGISASSAATLSVSGLPSGVTGGFTSITASSQNALTVTAGSSAVAGTYSVTVQATEGGATRTATIGLTISAPSLTVSSSSSSLMLPVSGSAGTTISVAGLSGSSSASLTTSGVPAGVTAAFSPATTSSASSLTFSAGNSVVSGTYSVAVTGTSGAASGSASIALTVQGAQAGNPTAISITQPTFGFNVLPGSVRRIYATVTNGMTNGVHWTVTGGATLSASTGNWVDVTAPSTGSSCSINGTDTYTVSSAKQLTLTAQSQENLKLTSSITINVCNPAVQVQVVPFYTTLYAQQKADIQAFVWGSVNRNVTWAITAQPNGGDGALMDSVNQDTAFSATVPGRYTLTATSVADGSKTNTATVYVTGHSMPYQVTPSETMPIDCSIDPALTGKTYEVGPSQSYKTIQSVPWSTLSAGSTVRIHNEDTTGGNPTTYHEYFQVTAQAKRTQPVRVCGVPDTRGNLPVIDASNSTGSSTVSSYSAGYTAVGIGATGWAGLYTGPWTGPQYIIVEGLKIQNAKEAYTYTPPAGGTATAWIGGAACVRLFRSFDTVVRGIDAYNCGNGFFSDFNANNGYAAVANTLYEGNHLHQNGNSGSFTEHQLYIQGWNEVAQFNVIDQYQSGAEGSNLKGRGFPEVIRYNHFGDGAARQLDMVDNQDASGYSIFEGYLGGGNESYKGIYPADQYTGDLLAAAVEAHHADYVYGNTFVNRTSGVPIHYATDHGSLENDRIGTLWFYSNSFYEPVCDGCPNWRYSIFDTSGGGGNAFPEIEWPQIQTLNNAIWMDAPTEPYFYWNNQSNQFTTFGKNVINSNWGTNNMSGGDGTGWAGGASPYAFQGVSNSGDNTGVSNLIGVSAVPFNESTFAPNAALVNAGTAMPTSAPKLPVRFQYGPSAVQVLREQPLTVGAME